MGGVDSAEAALEMYLTGASAIGVGTLTLPILMPALTSSKIYQKSWINTVLAVWKNSVRK